MNREVCSRKKAYDTEFEAVRACAVKEAQWGEALEHYKCGKHWHIAHVDPNLRNQHIRLRKDYCEACKQSMRPGRYAAHIKTQGHLREERKEHERARG